MKKCHSIGLLVVACALVAAGVLVALRVSSRQAIPEGTAQEQVQAVLEHNGCFVCHAQEPNLPFYAKLPVMKKVMAKHTSTALRAVDLESRIVGGVPADEAVLSMVAHVTANGEMPISQYRMIHWGSGVGAKEKRAVAEWVYDNRLNRFGYSDSEASEPVRPVPETVPYDAAKAMLGEAMYNDTRISLDGTISCASCHILKDGGDSDPAHRTSEGIYGQFGGVNAPTVYNAVFNVQQFWNGRAADLQEQAAGPPENPVEMGDQTWDQICERLREDKALVKLFESLYPGEGLTRNTVTGAIAEFEKTLITPDAPFDRYLKGETDAIDAQAIEGYDYFKRFACASCHTGVGIGGTSFERLGIFADYFAERSEDIEYCADDDGLKGFTGKDADLHRFKVPGLRNVALTAPYFHDGSMATLEDAVRAMARYELDRDLSDAEVTSLVAFMNSLTGQTRYLAQ